MRERDEEIGGGCECSMNGEVRREGERGVSGVWSFGGDVVVWVCGASGGGVSVHRSLTARVRAEVGLRAESCLGALNLATELFGFGAEKFGRQIKCSQERLRP